MPHRLTCVSFLFVSVLLFSGCGGSPKLTAVSGKVTQGGKAFTKGGSITFYPDKAKGNEAPQPSTGTLNASGEFSLKTGDKDGARPGWYKVAIVSHSPIPAGSYDVPKYYLDSKYASFDTTPLTCEVKEGEASYELNIP